MFQALRGKPFKSLPYPDVHFSMVAIFLSVPLRRTKQSHRRMGFPSAENSCTLNSLARQPKRIKHKKSDFYNVKCSRRCYLELSKCLGSRCQLEAHRRAARTGCNGWQRLPRAAHATEIQVSCWHRDLCAVSRNEKGTFS